MTKKEQRQQDIEDLDMLKYFWEEKNDMTRYVRYKECIDRFSLLKCAKDHLELAEAAMAAAFDLQERRLLD